MRNKWLLERLGELRKSQAGLGRELGLPRSRITDMINGTRRITATEGAAIAKYLEWPHGKVLALISDPSALSLNAELSAAAMTRIPVIGTVAAGDWIVPSEEVAEQELRYIEAPADPRYPNTPRYALDVKGPSMNEIYPDGSTILVVDVMYLGEGWRPNKGQRVVVRRTNNEGGVETTVKEFTIDDDGHAWLTPRSSHPAFRQAWRVPAAWEGDGEFDEHTDNLRVVALVTQRVVNEP